MKPRMNKFLFSLIFLSVSFQVYAQTADKAKDEYEDVPSTYGKQEASKKTIPSLYCNNHPEIIVAGGIAGAHTRSSHMQVDSLETDTLSQNNSYRWDTGTAQLGMGYIFYWVDGPWISNELRWFPTFEPMINLYYTGYKIKGDVYRFNSVFLDDTKYITNIRNTRLMLDAALTIFSKCGFSMYGLLGIGEGWSRLTYSDKMGTETRISLDAEHESNVVWEFGAGLVYAFDRNFSMSLEYLWTDLGRMKTSSAGIANGIPSPQLIGADFQVTAQALFLGVHVGLGK